MNIHLDCFECNKSKTGLRILTPVEIEAQKLSYRPVEDSSFYELTCEKGHTTYTILQNLKFEILFQMGFNALLDGYYREAVSSFAVSLERFYEFSIIALLTKNKKGISFENYENYWKHISKQSERQIGSFYSLYLNEFCKTPIPFDEKFLKSIDLKIDRKNINPVNFRNNVIHQGYIPTREQAIIYGEAVNKYIHHLLSEFNNYDDKMIHSATVFHLQSTRLKYGQDKHVGTLSQTTFINTGSEDYFQNETSLIEYCKNFFSI